MPEVIATHRWQMPAAVSESVRALASELAIPVVVTDLLMNRDSEETTEIAAEPDTLDRSRRSRETATLSEAHAAVEASGLARGRTLVFADESWHADVFGIVAARLAEHYWWPTAVAALEGDRSKGSARSVPGFGLHAALADCSPICSAVATTATLRA